MTEVAETPKPTAAPNSWFAILLGFVTLVIAGALAALMMRQYLESRPLDLTEHTRDLATKTRLLLETNRIPPTNIEVVASETRKSDTAVWWFYQLDVALPEELNARSVEQLMLDDLSKRNVVVKRLDSSDRLRTMSLALAGSEFAIVELRGGSKAPVDTVRDLTAASERIALEAYQVLRRRLAPTTRFTQHPSESQRDSRATWAHTHIEVSMSGVEKPLQLLEDIFSDTMANREVSVRSNGETISLYYLGFPTVDVTVVAGPVELSLPAIDTPVIPDPSPVDSPTEQLPILDGPASEPVTPEPAPTEESTPEPEVEALPTALPAQPSSVPQAIVERSQSDPRVAIIVDDGGNNQEVDDAILALDPRLTLAILPFTPFGRRTARAGSDMGFEIMLHMPMESDNESVTHPGMVYTTMEPAEIETRFRAALEEIPDVSGVNNHTGSRFTSSADDLRVVMDVMRERNLYFIDSLTSTASAVRSVARDLGVPTAARDVFLDNEANIDYIARQFDELVAKANERGWAIGICHFRPVTAEVMPTLIAKLDAAGIGLVHASELVR